MASHLRSFLFVPATRLDRIERALESGTDLVCVDLEDSVPEDDKSDCRTALVRWWAAHVTERVAVRTNAVTTRAGLHDLLALGDLPEPPERIFLPMVESTTEIDVASAAMRGNCGFIPLIETPAGLDRSAEIAGHPRVEALMFGGGDMSSLLGVALEWEPLLFARSRIVMAAANEGKPAIDVPFIRLGDEDGLAEESRRSKHLGFTAKAAIHPGQIATIHRVMNPTSDEIEEARAAIHAFDQGGGKPIRFRGRLLEAPVMRKFHQILAQGENE